MLLFVINYSLDFFSSLYNVITLKMFFSKSKYKAKFTFIVIKKDFQIYFTSFYKIILHIFFLANFSWFFSPIYSIKNTLFIQTEATWSCWTTLRSGSRPPWTNFTRRPWTCAVWTPPTSSCPVSSISTSPPYKPRKIVKKTVWKWCWKLVFV